MFRFENLRNTGRGLVALLAGSLGLQKATRRDRRQNRKMVFLEGLIPQDYTLEQRALLSTFTVTNNLDSGTGSFRAAVALANADNGSPADTIAFASSSVYPAVASTVILTAPNCTINGDGGQLGTTTTAIKILQLQATNVEVENLTINTGGAGLTTALYVGGVNNLPISVTLSSVGMEHATVNGLQVGVRATVTLAGTENFIQDAFGINSSGSVITATGAYLDFLLCSVGGVQSNGTINFSQGSGVAQACSPAFDLAGPSIVNNFIITGSAAASDVPGAAFNTLTAAGNPVAMSFSNNTIETSNGGQAAQFQIEPGSSVTMYGCTFSQNNDGAIVAYGGGSFTMSDSAITANTQTNSYNGIVQLDDGTYYLYGDNISGNTESTQPILTCSGGHPDLSKYTIQSCSISYNYIGSSTQTAYSGGAIGITIASTSDYALVLASTVAYNQTYGSGSGIMIYDPQAQGTAIIDEVTDIGNASLSTNPGQYPVYGAGLYCYNTTPSVWTSFITGNGVSEGLYNNVLTSGGISSDGHNGFGSEHVAGQTAGDQNVTVSFAAAAVNEGSTNPAKPLTYEALAYYSGDPNSAGSQDEEGATYTLPVMRGALASYSGGTQFHGQVVVAHSVTAAVAIGPTGATQTTYAAGTVAPHSKNATKTMKTTPTKSANSLLYMPTPSRVRSSLLQGTGAPFTKLAHIA